MEVAEPNVPSSPSMRYSGGPIAFDSAALLPSAISAARPRTSRDEAVTGRRAEESTRPLAQAPGCSGFSAGSFRNRCPDRSGIRIAKFHIKRECVGLTDDDLQVEVLADESRSWHVGTESCGRRGNTGSEA